MAKVIDPLSDRTAIRTFAQYLIAFDSRPEAASDVISGNFVGQTVDDNCVKCRDRHTHTAPDKFYRKPSHAAFSVVFRTSMLTERNTLVTSYPVWLRTMSAWMSVQNLVILG